LVANAGATLRNDRTSRSAIAPSGHVDRLYGELRSMAIGFSIKPDERINESVLAERLNASRTPLREALNRLVAEDLLVYHQGKGFFCRPLQPKAIFDLYETRLAIERETVRLACHRAETAAAVALRESLEPLRPGTAQHAAKDLVAFDEAFHDEIARLSQNDELCRVLQSINARIRFVRWIDMENRRHVTFGEHVMIADALVERDAEQACKVMSEHLHRRAEEIVAVVREGYSRIYLPQNVG
jgi:DNA-binding GntR family transcriptional regulator